MAALDLTVVNDTPHAAVLSYLPEGEPPHRYATLPPGGRLVQKTFASHRWTLVGECEEKACAQISMPASDAELRLKAHLPTQSGREAFYHQQIEAGVADIRVRASRQVGESAVSAAAEIVRGMLGESPPEVIERLRRAGCSVSVIARSQNTSDIPEHFEWAQSVQGVIPPPPPPPPDSSVTKKFVQRWEGAPPECDCGCDPCLVQLAEQVLGVAHGAEHQAEGVKRSNPSSTLVRELDSSTRGVGGSFCTSCGEENLVEIERDPHYPEESILVHEFGHTVNIQELCNSISGAIHVVTVA
ncbi:MAG: hypothetical protein SGPRY_009093 [Prymnesium sp.]